MGCSVAAILLPSAPPRNIRAERSRRILLNRIPADPAAKGGRVIAVAVVIEVGLGVVVLRGEAVGEDGGHRAGGGDRVAEGVVGVLGDDGAVLVPVADDIAVVVVAGEVEAAADRHGDQTADAAGARSQARLRLRLYGASREIPGRIAQRFLNGMDVIGVYTGTHE